MQSMRDSAANFAGASAKAGVENTKASMQEKAEKMKTRNPTEKEMARERKEQAEERKREARDRTTTAWQAGFAAGGFDGPGDNVKNHVYDGGRRVGHDDNNVGIIDQDDSYYGTYE